MRGSADIAQVVRDAENEWNKDAAIRAEFLTKESYVAWRKADARGAAQIVGKSVATAHPAHAPSSEESNASSLSERQAQARQQNIGRRFAGLPLLDIPQS